MTTATRFIDSDSHVLEPETLWDDYLDPQFHDEAPKTRTGYEETENGLGFYNDVSVGGYDMPIGVHGTHMFMGNLNESYDDYAREGFPASSYLDAMDRSGISYMVLYPSAGLYTNHAPNLSAAAAAAFRRAYNNWLYDFCSDGDGRLVGVGGLDLRDAEEAAREARRSVEELGFKGVYVNPSPVGDFRLYDTYYDRLWSTIEDLDVPLGIHVGAFNACDPMLYDYLPGCPTAAGITAFGIGNMIASAALIMGGVLERHPRLRVVHLECGAGWVAFWLYRMAAGIQGGTKGLEIPGLTLLPSEYFQRQCFISADPDDPGIKQVIDQIGDESIVVATDFGHPEGRHYSRAVER